MSLLIRIHPDNPQERLIRQVVQELEKGAVIIYPTDTIYALGCSIFQPKAIERIARLKHVEVSKARFSFVCNDLSDLSTYARQLDTPMFRLLKQHLPGPYTFILHASRQVPKIFHNKKSTIGLRVPDHKIALEIVERLGHPLLSTTLPGEMVEDYTDPELIRENFERSVDIVIDAGPGGMVPSTIIDLTGDEPELVREGKGVWEY
ncbi:MAG: L-threonylcarbamoyladenylate synthase [Chitinophagaceae bacterium]|nr:L-threonylcarbamoyladenylate synthase [Chitinophagaceae bacterium]MCU0403682.1 L-threonylcarbamoyladenylate synthase [Chitinophagaceae bacterium]